MAKGKKPRPRVEARVWLSNKKDYPFPDRKPGSDSPPPSTGVCFSGGGTRALSAAMGQLRGLRQLNLIDKIGYISSVSGGSWASTVFTYYSAGAQNDEQLLGPITGPADITWRSLDKLPKRCLGHTAPTDFKRLLLKYALDKDVDDKEVWIRAVGKAFLNPFGLYARRKRHFFSLDSQSVGEIIRYNPALAKQTFHLVRKNRPYLVLNSCLIWPTDKLGHENLVGFEYTPLYVGTPFRLQLSYKLPLESRHRRNVGGGILEPFAFGSRAPRTAPDPDGRVRVGLPRPKFTLADAAGTSSAAYSQMLSEVTSAFSPHVNYWPVNKRGKASNHKFAFGDGGSLENYGLIALLLRKVKKIVVFINTPTKLNTRFSPSPNDFPRKGDIDDVLPAFFGVGIKELGFIDKKPYPNNQVFPKKDFATVVRKLQRAKKSKKTDGVAIAVTELQVRKNNWWGVAGGWTAKICWVYLDRVRGWEQKLKPKLQKKIEDGNHKAFPTGPFEHFPNYSTVGQNPGDLVQLSKRQVNLLADLTCWSVTKHRKEIGGLLAGG